MDQRNLRCRIRFRWAGRDAADEAGAGGDGASGDVRSFAAGPSVRGPAGSGFAGRPVDERPARLRVRPVTSAANPPANPIVVKIAHETRHTSPIRTPSHEGADCVIITMAPVSAAPAASHLDSSEARAMAGRIMLGEGPRSHRRARTPGATRRGQSNRAELPGPLSAGAAGCSGSPDWRGTAPRRRATAEAAGPASWQPPRSCPPPSGWRRRSRGCWSCFW